LKQEIYKKAVTLSKEGKLEMDILMKDIMADPSMKQMAKQVSQFAGKLAGEIKKLSDADKQKYLAEIN